MVSPFVVGPPPVPGCRDAQRAPSIVGLSRGLCSRDGHTVMDLILVGNTSMLPPGNIVQRGEAWARGGERRMCRVNDQQRCGVGPRMPQLGTRRKGGRTG